MATYNYIVLQNSDASLTKRFRVIFQGYKRIKSKPKDFDKTIGGKIDYAVGTVFQQWQFVIKVRETESEANFGDKDDLETFFDYNNPQGTPSNVITMTDHYGVNHNVLMLGDFSEQPLSVSIEGTTAWFHVVCIFQEIP